MRSYRQRTSVYPLHHYRRRRRHHPPGRQGRRCMTRARCADACPLPSAVYDRAAHMSIGVNRPRDGTKDTHISSLQARFWVSKRVLRLRDSPGVQEASPCVYADDLAAGERNCRPCPPAAILRPEDFDGYVARALCDAVWAVLFAGARLPCWIHMIICRWTTEDDVETHLVAFDDFRPLRQLKSE